MARVFISYKRADIAQVLPLKERIEQAIGKPCWMALDGFEMDAQIIDAIEKAEIVLFMHSKRYSQSAYSPLSFGAGLFFI